MKLRHLMTIAATLCAVTVAEARQEGIPQIGAQVFIEPGQQPEDIDTFFRILHDNGLTAARIRMFGSHLCRNGQWDFTLYDEAFRAAERYGIRLFATLFPPTDELNDVGGFKFPSSKRHLQEVDDYVTAVVTHFRDFPALSTWVLQNEPGTGGVRVRETELSREVFAQWQANRPASSYDNGYLKADFTQEAFLRDYTTWYLRHIADRVQELDPIHGRHVNPHQLLTTLPEYDFTAYRQFLTSFGGSFHLSWHFGMFSEDRYPLGVSLMSDILRSGAGERPFWITELQGGNVTASGNVPYCPTAAHTAQYLWTSIAAGAEGIIFWTLNQRAAALEAGEWGLLDFQRRPSDRLLEAGAVARTLRDHAVQIRTLQPEKSSVTLLYNISSMRIQRRNAEVLPSPEAGRRADAVMRSLARAYEALSMSGITPAVEDMERFDWSDAAGRTAVIPNMVSLPSVFWPQIRAFVRNGGRLIVTGLSGFYDENMYCLFMNGFPLAECFGAEVSEFKVCGDRFPLGNGLTAHLWRGILHPVTATVESRYGNDAAVVRHTFGKGEVLWIPSPVELGADGDEAAMTALADFYRRACSEAIDAAPASFRQVENGILMRTMRSDKTLLTLVINKRSTEARIPWNIHGYKHPKTIYGEARVTEEAITLAGDSCAVILWEKAR